MRPMHLTLAAVAVMTFAAGAAAQVDAAKLKPETEQAWQQYIREAEARRGREIAARTGGAGGAGGGTAGSELPAAGRIVVTPAGHAGMAGAGGTGLAGAATGEGRIDVPSGLIHHWRGRVLIPGVTLEDVLHHVHLAPKQSDVLASKILDDRGDTLRVYLKLTRSEIITVTYNTEHLVEIRHHGPGRASSRSVATKIAELADANTPREREKPVGDDLGLLWRLHAYWWYEQVPGGVLVECESISLSRAIPFLLKPFASGMADRVARESMTRTLDTLRQQIRPGSGRLAEISRSMR